MLEDGIHIEIPQKYVDHIQAAGLDEDDLLKLARAGLARILFRRNVLSIGLAAELAGEDRAEFVADLVSHNINVIDLPVDALEAELDYIDKLVARRSES